MSLLLIYKGDAGAAWTNGIPYQGNLSAAYIKRMATEAGVTLTAADWVGQLNEIAGTWGKELAEAKRGAEVAAKVWGRHDHLVHGP